MPERLAGKSVVVLGGTSGIGLASAALAIVEGASVAVVGRSEEKLAVATERLGASVTPHRLDVTDEAAMEVLFSKMGSLDHLLVCSGQSVSSPVAGSDTRLLEPVFDIRVRGGYLAAKHAAPRMLPGGSITFLSGLSAHRPYPGSAVTAASTGAIEAFARALALELAPTRVNAICPGIVDTPLLDAYYGEGREEYVRDLAGRLPVGRVGTPEDIADAAMFLMTNGFVTGTVLRVDGGGALV